MPENVPVFLINLPETVRGFTCLGVDFDPIIVLNARMTAEQQRKTYRHEMEHIRCGHLWDDGYDDSVEYGYGGVS